jgi:hypothetical protein
MAFGSRAISLGCHIAQPKKADLFTSAEIYIGNRLRKTIHPFANTTIVPHRFK